MMGMLVHSVRHFSKRGGWKFSRRKRRQNINFWFYIKSTYVFDVDSACVYFCSVLFSYFHKTGKSLSGNV